MPDGIAFRRTYLRGDVVLADDDENSVIAKSVFCDWRVWWATATCLFELYFDGALAEAPANAGCASNNGAAAIMIAPRTKVLDICTLHVKRDNFNGRSLHFQSATPPVARLSLRPDADPNPRRSQD